MYEYQRGVFFFAFVVRSWFDFFPWDRGGDTMGFGFVQSVRSCLGVPVSVFLRMCVLLPIRRCFGCTTFNKTALEHFVTVRPVKAVCMYARKCSRYCIFQDRDNKNHDVRRTLPQSLVVFLSESEVQDDWQEEEPLLWRKKGCEVAGTVSM